MYALKAIFRQRLPFVEGMNIYIPSAKGDRGIYGATRRPKIEISMSNSLLGGYQIHSVRYKLHTFKPYAQYIVVARDIKLRYCERVCIIKMTRTGIEPVLPP